MQDLYHMGKLVPKEDIMPLSEYMRKRYEETGNLDYHFLNIADDIRNSADNYINVRVGCIIVKDGEIISSGYNDKGIHAEWIAIKKCMEKDISTKNAVLYTNLQPCLTCAHLIIASKIVKIVYMMPYIEICEDDDGKLSRMTTDRLLKDNGVESLQIWPSLTHRIRIENSENWKTCTLEEYYEMYKEVTLRTVFK